VYGNAWVLGYAHLTCGEHAKTPLQVYGSRHVLCYAGSCETGHQVAVGCEVHSISHWLENYRETGLKHGYSEEEIEEYKEYFDFFNKRLNKKT
jgi:hypothetical protein